MNKAIAKIRKVGNKYCVFSHSGKNLGCSTTHEGAVKRLQEVEYFKHTKGSQDMNYDQAFTNFAKALKIIDPTTVGQAPSSMPDKVDVAEKLRVGTIAGYESNKLLDTKDHFPVITNTQAQSSMARVMQLTEVPFWYRGTLAELRQEVRAGINKMHPGIELNIRIPVDQAVALSDGQTPATTSQNSIKDPNADLNKNHAPQVQRPKLTSAQAIEILKNEETRKTVAGKLMELIDNQLDQVKTAKKIAERLVSSGLTADEFDKLSTYLQNDILNDLLYQGVQASASTEDRRRALLEKLK